MCTKSGITKHNFIQIAGVIAGFTVSPAGAPGAAEAALCPLNTYQPADAKYDPAAGVSW